MTDEKHNPIAVLIIFFNKLSQTIECIESFLPSGQNIYILNNASDEVSWKALQQKYQHTDTVFLFNSDVNLGPARGRNLLLENCKEEWIFLVDNDICIEPVAEWITIFDKNVAAKKEALVFCPQLFNVHENSYSHPQQFILKEGVVSMEVATNEITNYFPCCAAIVQRKIFDTYGNFDAALFAFEDYEFSIRALCSYRGAFKVYPLPAIKLIHNHRVQQNKVDKKSVLVRYDEQKIKESMKRVMDKHNIIFDHDWQWWTRKQVQDMTANQTMLKIKNKISKWIGR